MQVKARRKVSHIDDIARTIDAPAGSDRLGVFDANLVSTQLMGDSIFINPMVLGYAWQKGWIPLRRESLLRAIELNGESVPMNKSAFLWGRRAAHDLKSVEAVVETLIGHGLDTRRRSTANIGVTGSADRNDVTQRIRDGAIVIATVGEPTGQLAPVTCVGADILCGIHTIQYGL